MVWGCVGTNCTCNHAPDAATLYHLRTSRVWEPSYATNESPIVATQEGAGYDFCTVAGEP